MRAASILPKHLTAAIKREKSGIRVSPLLVETAGLSAEAAYARLGTSPQGLASKEADERIKTHGPNVLAKDQRTTVWKLLWHAVMNPLVIVLVVLATISFLTDEDHIAGVTMMAMVALGVTLKIIQEAKADSAAAKLKAMISVTATVIRDGAPMEIPVSHLVPGDVVKLAAGDMIPGDIRLISTKDLFVIQGSLTGESLPVEKFEAEKNAAAKQPIELANIAFLGTSVESGSALAVVAATGKDTYIGSMASSLTEAQTPTSFDRGIRKFTWMMLAIMVFMAPAVFLINALTKHNPDGSHAWKEAFFFATAVAVGLTPEMLPMIVAVCLSKGAVMMSRKKVIVKRLNAIQNLGAMDVLCTDKTGTLTMDHVILEKYCDVALRDDKGVLTLAYLNSHFQTGLRNVLDRAILAHEDSAKEAAISAHAKVDEIPFDFQRRIMSVVVRTPSGRDLLVSKGAPESIFARCGNFELDGQLYPMDNFLMDELKDEYDQLSADGFRVLAVASKEVAPRTAENGASTPFGKDDEQDLVLNGYVAFLDPPKESTAKAIAALQHHGVAVKVVTGDNDLVARKICREVGLDVSGTHVLLGADVEKMDDARLADAAEDAVLFARVSPAHKQRIIHALQAKKHTVGFMGDGINDAPALRAADVGISVDTAVDIAKEAADMILLEKDLMVLEAGVLEGRKVFANILKYVRMGASSNFGNMFSVLGSSILFPFTPMLSVQILTNNLLYDFSQTAIPTDDVDPEQITKPRPWDMKQLLRFILLIGPISSIFDYTTFFLMWRIFKAKDLWAECVDAAGNFLPVPEGMRAEAAKRLMATAHGMGHELTASGAAHFAAATNADRSYAAGVFQTGWFIESLVSQTLIIHIIRTNRIPFIQSRASWPLIMTGIVILSVGVAIPYSPLGTYLGFTPLPPVYFAFLAGTMLAYMTLTQCVKTLLLKLKWI